MFDFGRNKTYSKMGKNLMPIELIDDSNAAYEWMHPSGVIFKIKHWTVGMQEEVDRNCVIPDWKGSFTYLASKERELKLKLALLDWSGVLLSGLDAPCTDENKMKLPVGVIFSIIREIDERAGFRISEAEKKT